MLKGSQTVGHSFIAGGNAKWDSHFGNSLVVYYKLNTLLPYNPATIFFGIYSNELKLMSTQKPAHRCL